MLHQTTTAFVNPNKTLSQKKELFRRFTSTFKGKFYDVGYQVEKMSRGKISADDAVQELHLFVWREIESNEDFDCSSKTNFGYLFQRINWGRGHLLQSLNSEKMKNEVLSADKNEDGSENYAFVAKVQSHEKKTILGDWLDKAACLIDEVYKDRAEYRTVAHAVFGMDVDFWKFQESKVAEGGRVSGTGFETGSLAEIQSYTGSRKTKQIIAEVRALLEREIGNPIIE